MDWRFLDGSHAANTSWQGTALFDINVIISGVIQGSLELRQVRLDLMLTYKVEGFRLWFQRKIK